MAVIEIKNLQFSYPGQDKKVLDDISLTVDEGEYIVICGKSGCGKSTLLRHMKSVLQPFGKKSGQILFENQELETVELRTQSSKIGFVFQNPEHQIVTDKVWHELAFGLESLGLTTQEIRLKVAEMASYFGIQDWFYNEVNELSGGQKQLLNLASVMAMNPSILILDEPTSQLDPIAAASFLETIKKINSELGTTILITEHRLEEVMPCADKVVIMEDGKILLEETPQKTGYRLYQMQHEMFHSMPTPVQAAVCISQSNDCPLTVAEGRKWLKNLMKDRKPKVFQHSKGVNKDSGTKPVITCEDVWFRYHKNSEDVLKGLSLSIQKGELFCILGGNGTGKSTALSLLCRLYQPYRGKILINGKDIGKYTDSELYHGGVGVLPQNPQSLFVNKTVREELNEMAEETEKIDEVAHFLHLEELMDRHPYDLSGGEQQRIALAKILLLQPKYLLLDEPTKGLDHGLKEEFAEILSNLKKQGVTLVMVSHDIEFCAKYADRCGLFFDGNVVSVNKPELFFSGNTFYTTAANRMSRGMIENAVTIKDVIEWSKIEDLQNGCL